MKRIISIILSVVMIVSVITLSVNAESDFELEGDTLVKYSGSDTTVVIPDGIKYLGDITFENNYTIEKVIVPDSVETIGYSCFHNCVNLKELHLGASVNKLGDNVIWESFNLCTLTVSEDNPYITSVDNVIYSKDLKTLVLFPDGFSGEFSIPEWVTRIGDYSFFGCNQLTSLTIPESVTEIGSHGLWGLSSIENITLPSGLKKICEKTFCECNSLKKIVIPDGVTEIEFRAFWNCKALEEIELPDSLVSFGNEVFYNCPMTTITVPAGVVSLGDSVFFQCKNLEKVIFEGDAPTTVGKTILKKSTSAKLYYNKGATGFSTTDFSKTTKTTFENCETGHYYKTFAEYVPDNYKCTDQIIINSKCERCESILYKTTNDIYGHDLVAHEAKEATCTEAGWEAYDTCRRCDFTTYVEIPAKGHEIEHHEAEEPTCTEIGWEAYDTCKNCDYTTYVEIEATGHKWGEYVEVKPATEEEDGLEERECSECHEKDSRIIPAILHIHTYDIVSEIIEATCTEEGYTLYKCRCGEEENEKRNTVEPLGHKTEHHEAKEATCTEAGWEAYDTCKNCDYTTYVEIPAKGHDTVHHEAKEATCTEVGWEAYDTCKNCDYTTYVEIPAKGHDFGNGEEKCKNCGEKNPDYIPPATQFKDVDQDAFYAAPVAWAVAKGITTGTSDTTFSPAGACTRGQVVTFLWRAAGEPEPTKTDNPFTDVGTNDYYYKAVLWAVEKGITNGTSADKFSPKSTCTRGQIVTFLWRDAGEPEPTKTDNPFTDVGPEDYYYKAVLWAVEKEITNGTSATAFSPKATCTRAQVVTFLFRGTKG